jgi:hypothetical protein
LGSRLLIQYKTYGGKQKYLEHLSMKKKKRQEAKLQKLNEKQKLIEKRNKEVSERGGII